MDSRVVISSARDASLVSALAVQRGRRPVTDFVTSVGIDQTRAGSGFEV